MNGKSLEKSLDGVNTARLQLVSNLCFRPLPERKRERDRGRGRESTETHGEAVSM